MANNRKVVHLPIKYWIEWDMLSKEFNLKKVNLMHRAFELIKNELYQTKPYFKQFTDYLSDTDKSNKLLIDIINRQNDQIDKLSKSLTELLKKIDK